MIRTDFDQNYVVIQEEFTETSWRRKIGDGPWEDIDLSLYGGRAPVVFLKGPKVGYQETWVSKKEAKLLCQPSREV